MEKKTNCKVKQKSISPKKFKSENKAKQTINSKLDILNSLILSSEEKRKIKAQRLAKNILLKKSKRKKDKQPKLTKEQKKELAKHYKKTKKPKIMFCPNSKCKNHRFIDLYNEDIVKSVPSKYIDNTWYINKGTHANHTIKRLIQRFKCKECKSTFSTQTFETSYYMKIRISFESIIKIISNSNSESNLSRLKNHSPNAISNAIYRYGKQAIAIQSLIRSQQEIKEDIVIDGIEDKIKSKYFPQDFNIAIGKESQYIYFYDNAHYRRKGKTTNIQKSKQKHYSKIYNYEKRSIYKSTKRILNELLNQNSNVDKITIYSDEKKEYKQAIKNICKNANKIRHETISSKIPRTKTNPLFSVNYIDINMRRDLANFRRKTTCLPKEINKTYDRLALYFLYNNLYKNYRAKGIERILYSSDMANIPRETMERIKRKSKHKRLFLSSLNLTSFEKQIWQSKIKSPFNKPKYRKPKYIFQ